MQVLLDENIPRKLKRQFPKGVIVKTVPEQGWSGKKNGARLAIKMMALQASVGSY